MTELPIYRIYTNPYDPTAVEFRFEPTEWVSDEHLAAMKPRLDAALRPFVGELNRPQTRAAIQMTITACLQEAIMRQDLRQVFGKWHYEEEIGDEAESNKGRIEVRTWPDLKPPLK